MAVHICLSLPQNPRSNSKNRKVTQLCASHAPRMCLCGNLARLLIYCAYLWPLDGLFARQGSTHNFKSRWIVFIWFLSFIWPEKKNRIHSTLMTHNAHLMRKQSGSFLALCGMALITDQPRTFFFGPLQWESPKMCWTFDCASKYVPSTSSNEGGHKRCFL